MLNFIVDENSEIESIETATNFKIILLLTTYYYWWSLLHSFDFSYRFKALAAK